MRPDRNPDRTQDFTDPEAVYSYPRDEAQTVLAYVSANLDRLSLEFWDWFAEEHLVHEDPHGGLTRWEVVKFGHGLHRTAHGVLWFQVRQQIDPASRAKKSRAPRRPDVLSEAERLRRFDEAVGKAAREAAMPETPNTEQRRQQLERQAGEDRE